MIFLYIDPGTGSMLFAALIGAMGTLLFFLRKVLLRLKFYLSGGQSAEKNGDKITYLIFSDSKRYWNVFKPVCDRFEELGIPAEYWTMSEDDPAFSENYSCVKCTYIGSGNRAYARLNLASASICLATTPGLEVYQWKRSRDIDWYVHIYHMMDEGTTYRMFGLDFYDAVLLTGPIQERYIRILEEKRGLKPKELYMTGCTYMDALDQKVRAYRLTKKEEKSETKIITVLVAPSWGPAGILSKFGAEFIDALLKTKFHIVIRPHPQSVESEKAMLERLTERYAGNDRIEWNYDNDNFEVLNRSDVLISDFSGVLFDFALALEKPVIYADTTFDPAIYDAAWIDEPLWKFTVLDKLGVRLNKEGFGELQPLILGLLGQSVLEEGRKQVCKEAWQYRGQAAERTVDYLIRKAEEMK
ncbi:MAG: CDP-glycerol glycerophosphotransferase family protein [Lachnospiraceae bacterium]|nr:CDP-glycerol glycerophosphotransferase family protein [Lachnospiraceae bacterium]